MSRPPNPATIPQSNQSLLRVYVYYRTLLSALLLFMYSNQLAPNILGTSAPQLFHFSAIFYTALNAIALAILWRVKFYAKQQQRFVLFVIDIAAISLLVYASADASAGLSYLLIISIAAGSMLLRGQIAIALAALATITIISINLIKPDQLDGQALFAAGSLGTMLFITAVCFLYLTQKIKASSEEAFIQTKQAAHSQRLAQTIVERMRTGIMVLNKDNRIEMVNQSAKQMLNLTGNEQYQTLCNMPELEQQIKFWRTYYYTQNPVCRFPSSPTEVKISFAELEPGANSDTLIFIEDNRAISQKAQQLKLASLGRLTASIAHEVRNPLGAISHASQLLAEAEALTDADKRLTEIIGHHSLRVNQIIENVLQLSSRKAAQPETFELNLWLQEFVDEYQQGQTKELHIRLNLCPEDLQAKFDFSQLRQVLSNLIDNGLRYSFNTSGEYKLLLEIGFCIQNDAPYIHIKDYGIGIKNCNLQHIFEPFFTTEKTGSGLGLFICQELCEANQAMLSYQQKDNQLSCFELQFAPPQKTL
jgi:two-component system sensor histidine kinase PilS (NtrC family)